MSPMVIVRSRFEGGGKLAFFLASASLSWKSRRFLYSPMAFMKPRCSGPSPGGLCWWKGGAGRLIHRGHILLGDNLGLHLSRGVGGALPHRTAAQEIRGIAKGIEVFDRVVVCADRS